MLALLRLLSAGIFAERSQLGISGVAAGDLSQVPAAGVLFTAVELHAAELLAVLAHLQCSCDSIVASLRVNCATCATPPALTLLLPCLDLYPAVTGHDAVLHGPLRLGTRRAGAAGGAAGCLGTGSMQVGASWVALRVWQVAALQACQRRAVHLSHGACHAVATLCTAGLSRQRSPTAPAATQLHR